MHGYTLWFVVNGPHIQNHLCGPLKIKLRGIDCYAAQ